MTHFALDPLHIGDYVVLSLVCVTASIAGFAALVCCLVHQGPDRELEHYADDVRPTCGAPDV